MTTYTLDVMVAMTVQIQADDEAAAREIFDNDPLKVMWDDGNGIDTAEIEDIHELDT